MSALRDVICSILPSDSDIDDSTLDYFESLISDIKESSECHEAAMASVKESLTPFFESYGIAPDLEAAEVLIFGLILILCK
jgi:hypothetical protein